LRTHGEIYDILSNDYMQHRAHLLEHGHERAND